MSLFTSYEEAPPRCQAAPVWHDTVDAIAAYYCGARGYVTTIKRDDEATELRIIFAGTTDPYRDGCDLTVTLPHHIPPTERFMLIYAHPPYLAPYEEFHAHWREVQEPLTVAEAFRLAGVDYEEAKQGRFAMVKDKT